MKKMRTVKTDRYTLIHGDFFSLRQHFGAFALKVDFVFTDPPYEIAKVSTGTIKFDNREDINKDLGQWDHDSIDIPILCQELAMYMKETANIAVFCAYHQYPQYWEYLDNRFDTFIPWYYCKTNPSPSIRKTSFRQGVEIICCAWNKGHYFNFGKQQDMLNWKTFPICMGNERLKNGEGKTLHPTQKRLDLCKYHIEIMCPPDGIVLDPFAGTGSIGIAALELGRKYIGIERDETYFLAMEERFRNATKQD